MYNRLIEIDAMRGIAIILMVIFHIALADNLFSNKSHNLHNGFFDFIGEFSRTTFLVLVGASLVLAYKKKKAEKKSFKMFQVKRGVQLILYGLIVTFLTKLVLPQQYVAFGILHFIGLSIILLSFVIDKKFIIFLMLIVCLTTYGKVFFKNPSLANYILGTNTGFHGWTIDYFPLLKNLPKVIVGILFRHFYSENPLPIPETIRKHRAMSILETLGKQSLNIYMIHLPIVYLTGSRLNF